MKKPDNQKLKILIIKLSAIGDVIHTLPALNAIRNSFPDARITWLVEEAAAGFVENHEALDRVIVSKRKKWGKNLLSPFCLSTIKEIFSFIKELRDSKYDLVIDFQGLLKSGVLAGLCRSKRKIGYDQGMEHMEYSYLFLNERIPPVDMNNHAIIRSMMLIKVLGVITDKIIYNLPVFETNRKMADDLISRSGLKKIKPLVAINPMAKWETKLWNNIKFAKLADLLIEKLGAGIIFTGSRQDQKTIQDIIFHMQGNAANLAGATSLKTLAGLYEKTDFVISTDTGPMHLAAAMGTPVVALFGPTAPWRTGPFGLGHQVIRAGLECSPCFKRQCKTIECMQKISVEQVFESALDMSQHLSL